MQSLIFDKVVCADLTLPAFREKNVQVSVLRLDLAHEIISGNKWFKLKYYLEHARRDGKKMIATFGGPFSNHIVATAASGKLFEFETAGIIRGETPAKLSHSLEMAMAHGMRLFFVSRDEYAKKLLPQELKPREQEICLVPEGGYGKLGVAGAAEILDFCRTDAYTHIACALGTGTTMAGLVRSASVKQHILGFSVMKNNQALESEIKELLDPADKEKSFQIVHEYHFGGYAKYTKALISFMNDFYTATQIPTDFVYTAKLFYGVVDMILNDRIPRGSRLLIIHSGGLQGNGSLPEETLIF